MTRPHCLPFISIAAAAVLTLAGCASRSPDVRYYNLSPVTVGDPASSELAIAVGPAEFPGALDRAQIATRFGPNRIEYDDFHRWANVLRADFVSTVGTNLSRLLGTDRIVVYPDVSSFAIDYRVTFAVQRFDATADGDVTLETRWVLTDAGTGEAVLVRQFATIHGARADDYDARAAAHSEAVAALSREVAAAIGQR